MAETEQIRGRQSVKTPKSTTVSKTTSLTQPVKSKTLGLPSSYVSILSSNPPKDSSSLTVEITEQNSSQSQITREIDINNPSMVWSHAIKLAGAGRVEEASKFFQIHESLSLAKKEKERTSVVTRITTKEETQESSQSTHLQSEKTFSKGGLTFIPGAVTSHMDIGFTLYFDKNLRELKGPIPLTIFNRQWQDLANSYHVEKRVKVENLTKDITTYTGYPYPHEMTQLYATWNTNYRNFVRTLRDVYHFKRFAEWAEIHQANVEFYHTRDNWMTAFRYDIKIRLNAFAFRVSYNGTNAPPDISQRREDIAAICFAEARRLDEGSFKDNPYAKGGPRFGYDWTTGLPRSSNNSSTGGSHNSNLTNSSSSNDHGNQGLLSNHSNNGLKRSFKQSGGGGRQRGGYQGSNFDPNHAAKKQASSKNTPAPAAT